MIKGGKKKKKGGKREGKKVQLRGRRPITCQPINSKKPLISTLSICFARRFFHDVKREIRYFKFLFVPMKYCQRSFARAGRTGRPHHSAPFTFIFLLRLTSDRRVLAKSSSSFATSVSLLSDRSRLTVHLSLF